MLRFQEADENGNQYPQIYAEAIDTNSLSFYRQLINLFAPRRERGIERVDISAYLKKTPIKSLYKHFREEIVKAYSEKTAISADQNDYDIVFVWDIDDVTMLTTNHIDELTMLRPDINTVSLYNIRERICYGVNNLENSISIKRAVDNIKDVFIGETDEMKNAISMYDSLRKLYDQTRKNGTKEKDSIICYDFLENLETLERKELYQTVKKHQKVFNQRWKYVRRCFELVNRRSEKSKNKKYANVVLCDEGIASGISQILLSNLSSTIPVENLYSTLRVPGEPGVWYRMKEIRDKIQHRFGAKCLLIHVSSGPRYAGLDMELWPIKANESVELLSEFQKQLLK